MTDIKISGEVRARLAQLENENGQITPTIVVEDAKRKDSPLHNLFDWDVKSAAAKYWIEQARVIIRSVNLVSSGTETVMIKSPYYVRDPNAPAQSQGYIAVASLQKDPAAARESVRLEFGRAESALSRARLLAGVLNMESEIESLMKRLGGLKERLAEPKTKQVA